MLTSEQIGFYMENGYLRIPQVFTPEEIQAMSRDLDQVIQDWAVHNEGWIGPWRQVYMRPEVEQRSKLIHLNDLHFYSETWCRAVLHPRLTEAMVDLLGPCVELHHTTLHCKPPETGMPFPMHQDSPFYQHEGPAYVDAILHIDSATEENGCLKFLPGSHKSGHLEHITENSSPHLPTDHYRLADAISCPADSGDVVAFSIYTVHGSEINRTDRWRRLVRVGYRDPRNKQIGGHGLGRPGLMVRGLRPIEFATS
ncbi:MAG TPA: phytanoyl-CoA dioxygenase family protein [Chthonomonadaceae bacterium]|nr:phytanoyl-CoA dioxygenase family protein [Chthonomonadaceae bacterium]